MSTAVARILGDVPADRRGQIVPRRVAVGAGEQGRRPAEPLPVSRLRPAYQQVADQLRELILGGSLSPGDRLPNEADLCASFGVSRSTIREAIRVLSSRGLVYTLRGTTGGTFVNRIRGEDVSDYLEASIGMMSGAQDITLENIIEARLILETPAARLAAERRTEEDLEGMSAGLLMEAGEPDWLRKTVGQRSFHSSLVAASGNEVLQVLADPLLAVLASILKPPALEPETVQAVHADHVEITEAVRRQDPDAAEDAARRHLERLAELYRST